MSNSFADLIMLNEQDENENAESLKDEELLSSISNDVDDGASNVDSEPFNNSNSPLTSLSTIHSDINNININDDNHDEDQDDVITTASSVFSTYHSRLRKKERLFTNDRIKKIKKFGCYDKQRVPNKLLEIRWKIEYEGDIIILSEDFKTLITCYQEENPAIPFYNDLCDRFDTCGRCWTKYETKITLEEFKQVIKGGNRFFNMNFEIWPMNKPILLQTARNGRLDLMKYLIEECNYNPFVVGKGKYTILHYACYDGRYEMIEYLIKNTKLRQLFQMRAKNGESGFDALVISKSTKITSEEDRKKCMELFDSLEEKKTSKSDEIIVSLVSENEAIEDKVEEKVQEVKESVKVNENDLLETEESVIEKIAQINLDSKIE